MPFREPEPNQPPRRPPFRPLAPSPQEPYVENPWGPSVDTNLPNPQFPQGDGTYGPSPPLNPVPVLGPGPVEGPVPPEEFPQVIPNTDNPFAENYDPLPQSHDRYGPNYVPPIIPPRAGSAGITPEQKRKMEEAAAFRPTGPPAAMDPRTR